MWASGRSPGASTRPGPASGFTLIEILLAAALIVSLTTIALPWFGRAIEAHRAHAAARYLAARFALARLEAVKRSARVGLRFDGDGPAAAWTTYVDGNANGIRSRDITAGIDTMLRPAERLADLFPEVVFGLHESVPEIGSSSPAAGDRDPIRIGSGQIVTFTPIGTATSGTLYLHGRGLTQYAVRVLGVTGRTRVMRFDPGAREWVAK